MTPSNWDTTKSPSPNGQDSSSQGLLSVLWSWINSYGGLSDLRRYNANLRKSNEEMKKETKEMKRETEEMRKKNKKLAELELKLDIVLQLSDSGLTPTVSTEDN